MCFLADEYCDFAVVRVLRAHGHDVLAVSEFQNGSVDKNVMDLALAENRMAPLYCGRRPDSRKTFAFRRLSREQKGLDRLTLAANDRAGESLVPLAAGHLGLAIEPLRQQL
jgi:hypothetical protein